MTTTVKSNKVEKYIPLYSKVKTVLPIMSLYSDYKGNKYQVYIPVNTELEVIEVYGIVGVDVNYGDVPIFLYSYEVVVITPSSELV